MTVKKREAVPQALQRTGDPFEVSQSTIKVWRRCHQKYYYSFIELIEKRKPVIQLIRGTMIGKCLDAIALRRMKPKSPQWQTALEPYRKQYARLFAAEREIYGDPIAEVERIVARYETIYSDDGFEYLTGPDGNPFELPVRVEISPGIVFTGHIDKMPRDKHGRVWDLDHKSHKNIPDAEDRFADLQQLFYQWAMPLSGYPKPTGVIWDYIRTKPPAIPEQLKNGELSQRKNIDTDYSTYLAEVTRLGLNPKDYPILKDLKVRGFMDFYQRVPLPTPSKDLIKNVVAEATETALQIKQMAGKSKIRSIDRTCKSCQFYNLCQAEFRGLDASFIRKSEYQVQSDPRHVHVIDDTE